MFDGITQTYYLKTINSMIWKCVLTLCKSENFSKTTGIKKWASVRKNRTNAHLIYWFLTNWLLILFLVKVKDKTLYRPFRGRFWGVRKILRQISMFLYAVRYQSWFLPKIRCKCLRFFVAKIQKPMEKPILLVAFDMLGRLFR